MILTGEPNIDRKKPLRSANSTSGINKRPGLIKDPLNSIRLMPLPALHHYRLALKPLALAVCSTLIASAGAVAEEKPFKVEIAIPHANGELPYLIWGAKGSATHFHVNLFNVSGTPINIFQEWCSWSYDTITFEMTDAKGQKWVAHEGLRTWTRNFPAVWTLNPKNNHVRDIYLADSFESTDGFVLQPGNPNRRVTLTAICEVHPDRASERLGVWTGRIVSDPVECVIATDK
jgi:hypothetical protein